MKYTLLVVSTFIFTACGNDSSNAPLFDDTTAVAVSGACANSYYTELLGIYDGRINYTSPNISCSWSVDFEVSGRSDSGYCFTNANTTSELLTGDNSQCGDIAQAGQFVEPLLSGFTTNPDVVVTWPVEGDMLLNARIDDGLVYPVGKTGGFGLISYLFDGRGNVTFPNSIRLNDDESFTGVLVKQSD